MTEQTTKRTVRKTAKTDNAELTVEAVVELPINEEKDDSVFEAFLTHQRQAIVNSGKALESLLPDGVRTHGQKAVEEMIEGYRILFNNAVDNVVDRVRKTETNLGELADRVQKVRLEEKEDKDA